MTMQRFWSSPWSLLIFLLPFFVGAGVAAYVSRMSMEPTTVTVEELYTSMFFSYDQGVRDGVVSRLGLAERMALCLHDTSYYSLSYSGNWERLRLDSLRQEFVGRVAKLVVEGTDGTL